MCEKALREHKEVMTKRFTTDSEVLNRAYEFAKRWAGKKTTPGDFKVREVLTSGSACYEHTRSQGGLSAARLYNYIDHSESCNKVDVNEVYEAFEFTDSDDDPDIVKSTAERAGDRESSLQERDPERIFANDSE